MEYLYAFAQNGPQFVGMIPFLFWDIPFGEVPWRASKRCPRPCRLKAAATL
jgi:hypothetical protein